MVAAVNDDELQVAMPFCWSFTSLGKSTFARVVGFGIWFGLPELVDDTSVNSETGAPFPLFGSLLGEIVPVSSGTA